MSYVVPCARMLQGNPEGHALSWPHWRWQSHGDRRKHKALDSSAYLDRRTWRRTRQKLTCARWSLRCNCFVAQCGSVVCV